MSNIPELHKKYRPRYLTFDTQGNSFFIQRDCIVHLVGLLMPNAISWLFTGLNLISHSCP